MRYDILVNRKKETRMSLSNIFLWVVAIIIICLLSLILGVFITGRDGRSYPVFSPDDQFSIGTSTMNALDLARKYKPGMFLDKDFESPPLLWTWYEVAAGPTADTIDIVYYNNWQDEINPNPTIHTLYSFFRAAFYGYPLYDIEYIQVRVSRSSGQVVGLLFETSPVDNYYIPFAEHHIVRYVPGAGGYEQIETTRQGQELSRTPGIKIAFDDTHARIAVQTWNHLSRLFDPARDTDAARLDTDLKFLSDPDYAQYKFVRKSQGDHKTQENSIGVFIATTALIVLIGLPFRLLRMTQKRTD
jgi:hypothetical protein